MAGRRSFLLLLVVACSTRGIVEAGDRPPPGQVERAMTAAIDDRLARSWADSGVEPAPRSSDSEFLRRAWLDLGGKIPTVADARSFLDDADPEKRRKVVERILQGPSATTHFTNIWRGLLVPGLSPINVRLVGANFDQWLGDQFDERKGFDQAVRELLTYPLENAGTVLRVAGQPRASATPLAFYAAREYKPEDLASGTARLFLGVRIECAQCHDHPFAAWKRDQFWEFAANFGGITRQGPANVINARIVERKGRAELPIPGTGRMAQAGFLDGTWDKSELGGGRESLAAWITSPANPYFAKAIVNRAWAQLFGVGFVDPIDDFSETNPSSHPELLDDLARGFVDSGFNLPLLFRAIAASRAYQLTSEGPPERSDEPRLFARMAVKAMSGEQWYDSLTRAIGLPPEPVNRSQRIINPSAPRSIFLEKFASTDDRAVDRPTSILQALTLMHGPPDLRGNPPEARGNPGRGRVGAFPRHPREDRGPLPRLADANAPTRRAGTPGHLRRVARAKGRPLGRLLGDPERGRIRAQSLTKPESSHVSIPSTRVIASGLASPVGERRGGLLGVRMDRDAGGRLGDRPEAAEVVHPPLDGRRAKPARHARPQAWPRQRRADQGHRDERAGPPHRPAPAGSGQADDRRGLDPIDEHEGRGSHPGHVPPPHRLHADRANPLPVAGLAGGQGVRRARRRASPVREHRGGPQYRHPRAGARLPRPPSRPP